MEERRLIALTGATGFIGRRLLEELPKRGYRMRMLLRRPIDTPLPSASAVVGDLAQPRNLSEALRDVDAVIHSVSIAPAMSGTPQDDYRLMDTKATLGLARAAERAGAKRFVFLSSIRAACGATSDRVITEACDAQPTDAYGRAKLAAEQGLAQLDIDYAALRPTLVYGPGMKGNLASLVRLARTPYPLPLAVLTGRRSLLAIDNLVDAIDTALASPGQLRRPFVVADDEALTVPEMIAAMRTGLHRRSGLFPAPLGLLKTALRAADRSQWWDLLIGSQIADASALKALGWTPRIQTQHGLAALMQAPPCADKAAR
jgi:nucleoside-diphosphate-sugar epimerase